MQSCSPSITLQSCVMWMQWCRPTTRLTGNYELRRGVLSHHSNNKTNVLPTFQVHNLLTGTLLLSTSFMNKKLQKKKTLKTCFYYVFLWYLEGLWPDSLLFLLYTASSNSEAMESGGLDNDRPNIRAVARSCCFSSPLGRFLHFQNHI